METPQFGAFLNFYDDGGSDCLDMDDIAFVASSKYMGEIKLWAGDQVLMNGLNAKGFKTVLILKN